MLHVFTMQKKLNSVINKLVLVAQRKMSGSYKSSYRIRALVCLMGYGGLFFFQRLLPMRCFPRQAKHVIRKWSCLRFGMNGVSYAEQKSWVCSWWRWRLALVLRIHRELQPLKEELKIKGWKSCWHPPTNRIETPPSLVGRQLLADAKYETQWQWGILSWASCSYLSFPCKKWKRFFMISLAEDMLLCWNFLSHLNKIFKRWRTMLNLINI